jgi:hypothetical protein
VRLAETRSKIFIKKIYVPLLRYLAAYSLQGLLVLIRADQEGGSKKIEAFFFSQPGGLFQALIPAERAPPGFILQVIYALKKIRGTIFGVNYFYRELAA